MWNNKFEKGLTIVEAMVAAAILGMIVVVFLNSSSIFMKSQQDLIKMNKRDQIADLIIQDISEYVKSELHPYGNAIVENFDNSDNPTLKQINISGVTEVPEVGDIFAIEGIGGKYRIDVVPVHVGGTTYTITTREVFPIDTTIVDGDMPVTFLAFNKLKLECFTGDAINLKEALSVCPDPTSEIYDLVESWKIQIANEGAITKAEVEMTDEQLFKVTLGDGTSETSLAKKFVQCAFSASETERTVNPVFDFVFSGMGDNGEDLRIPTGIMEGTDNPVLHFAFDIDRTNTNYSTDGLIDGPLDDYTLAQHDCSPSTGIRASTCRQNYAKHRWITVFLYRYIGASLTPDIVQPAGCEDQDDWDQCAERITFNGRNGKEGDLSIWFIFSEANESGKVDEDGVVVDNQVGYIGFSIEYLNENAKVGVFDDSGESCLASIISMAVDHDMHDGNLPYKCEGGYDYNGAHDGLVVHLATDLLSDLYSVTLDVINPADNLVGWRVLNQARCDPAWIVANPERDPTECDRINPDPCLIAQATTVGGLTSAHENGKDLICWTEVTAPNMELAAGGLSQGTTDVMRVSELTVDGVEQTDFAKFPASGYLQVGNEAIHYTSKGDNEFRGLTRAIRNTVHVAANNGDNIIFKDLCNRTGDTPVCTDGDYTSPEAQHARIISGEINQAAQGSKLRIGRWIGWVDDVGTVAPGANVTTGIKIQQRERRVFSNYQENKFFIEGGFGGIGSAIPDEEDDFIVHSWDGGTVGDKYVASYSGDLDRPAGTTVYGISMGAGDTIANSQVSILNNTWTDNRDFVDGNSQNTITIPRRVELDFEGGRTEVDTTVTCTD